MTDDKEERREYRKNLLWACSVDSDAVANRITELELRIIELEADYAKLINHTDPDYVIGLQLRIKELEVMAARYSALLEETDRQKARIKELEEELGLPSNSSSAETEVYNRKQRTMLRVVEGKRSLKSKVARK